MRSALRVRSTVAMAEDSSTKEEWPPPDARHRAAVWAAEGHIERSPIELRMYVVSPSYFHAMGIALRDGRLFNDFDGRDAAPRITPSCCVPCNWPRASNSSIGS